MNINVIHFQNQYQLHAPPPKLYAGHTLQKATACGSNAAGATSNDPADVFRARNIVGAQLATLLAPKAHCPYKLGRSQPPQGHDSIILAIRYNSTQPRSACPPKANGQFTVNRAQLTV